MIDIKVLVCGSYKGAFQEKLNQRLKKEKHEVFVLTDDTADEKKASAVFQDYRFPYKSDSVFNVMTSVSPDAVIFCGAMDEAYDWSNEVVSSVDYVAGVMNIASCAAMANVGQFIYLSSLDVFLGNTDECVTEETLPVPVGQREKAILQGEKICTSVSTEKGIPETSVVRLPQVYGVCGKRIVRGVCTDIAEIVGTKSDKHIHKLEECRLMYLDDAVDAVYKVLVEDSGKRKELYHILPQKVITKEVIYDTFQAIEDGSLQETAIQCKDEEVFVSHTQKDLGSVEKYSLEDGLRLFYSQYMKIAGSFHQKTELAAEPEKQRKPFWPIIETILFFVLTQVFMIFTKNATFHEVIDVYLVFVLVIAVVLGALPATIAVLLSIIGKYYLLFMDNHTLNVFTEYTNYLWILQIFSLSVLIGYIKDQYARNMREMKRENEYLKNENDSLKTINKNNVEVKDIFEKRLVNYKDSYAKVYDMVSKLDDLETKSIIFKAATVVADVMESKDVAIYTYEGKSGFCRLMASTSEFAKSKGKTFKLNEYEAVQEKLFNSEIYMNRSADENMPMFATGIYSGENLEVIIMIWDIDLLNVNLYKSNLLTMVSKLMERSMSKALRYMDSVKNSTYIPETSVMEADAFYSMLDIYCAGEGENVLEYSLLEIGSYEGKESDLYQILSDMIRETDYIGLGNDGKIYVLLTNSSKEESASAIERFTKRGVSAQLVNKNSGKTVEEVFTDCNFGEAK